MRRLVTIGMAVALAVFGASCATAPGGGEDRPRLTFEEAGGPERLAAERKSTCAAHGSSKITCWGERALGSDEATTVEVGGPVEEIDYEDGRLCALHSGGSLTCWGYPFDAADTEEIGEEAWVPKRLKGEAFDELAMGTRHLCVLRAESREVVCAGLGRVPDVEEGRRDVDQAAPPQGRFRRLAAAGLRTCGVTAERRLVCWGRRFPGTPRGDSGPWRFQGSYVSVTAGPDTVCGITVRGEVRCRGLGTDPGHYEAEGDYDQGVAPEGAYRSVVVGQNHGCGRTMEGSVRCWGLGADADRMEGEHDFDQAVPGVQTADDLAVGAFHSCATVDGGVQCWGADEPKEGTRGHSEAEGQANVPPPLRPGATGDGDD